MDFNPSPAYILMLDINSCFATIEQQANPRLRGKPVVVGAYTTNNGCILAASREAKTLGIATGMRVVDARRIYPRVIVLPSDPSKYRFVNKKLFELVSPYTSDIVIKSIDELAMDFRGSPYIGRYETKNIEQQMVEIAREIKTRIKNEIGEWITVSIGIAPNQYLAKVGSGYQKPDGLTVITHDTVETILGSMKLTDLCGIKEGYGARLQAQGITTALGFYRASAKTLCRAFRSKIGYDWWARLHGWSTSAHAWDSWSSSGEEVKSIGHSHALAIAYPPADDRLHQILCQLTEKMARRMRSEHFRTRGVHVSCFFADHSSWGHGEKQSDELFAGGDLYRVAKRILLTAPNKPVRILAVTSYALVDDSHTQQSLLVDHHKKEQLMSAVDSIENRWGDFTVFPARMLGMEHKVLDRIAFGGGKTLQRTWKRSNV